MAVIQISKIQVRRGQKNSNSGIPQLSSAEFAWAVDSQELYIGNGSVAEGAPYVGNTRIITEHDNLLELAASYQFAVDYLSGSVPRSLQGKLDEYVSVADFGAVGDGSTDCVAAFETAFTQLFRNVDVNYKKVLMVPNGEYLFLSDLKIPTGTILKGETKDGAKLNIGSNNIQFISSTGAELAAFDGTNRPENVNISNLTIQRTTGQTVLSGLANSTFTDVSFIGQYELTDTITDIDVEAPALFWDNSNNATKTTNIEFDKCRFQYNSISIKSIQSATDNFETNIRFNDCDFFVNYYGIYINSNSGQLNAWEINNSRFEEIFAHAFKSTNGRSTLISKTVFKNCGNGNGLASSPLYPIVYFGEKTNNIVTDCSSNRYQSALVTTDSTTLAIPEVYNSNKTFLVDKNQASIFYSASATPFAVISALNKTYTIRYLLTLGTHSRTGKLTISINDGSTDVAITDEYQYSPSLTTDLGGPTMTNFEFSAVFANNDLTAGNETVVLNYRNPTASAEGTLSFDVTYGV